MSESIEQNKPQEVKIEEPIVICPHCKEPIVIEKLNCGIFRHGVSKATGQQIAPHLDKQTCDSLKEQDLIDVINGDICKVPERMKDARRRWENGESTINYWIKNQPIFNF